MILKLGSSLNSSVADLTNLDRVEFIPFSLMKIFIKISNKFGMNKVKKSVTNIAIILNKFKSYIVVNRKIEKVKFFFMIFLKQLKKHILSIFIWNISDHYSCSTICLYPININPVVFRFLCADCSSIANSWNPLHIVIVFLWEHLHHHLDSH